MRNSFFFAAALLACSSLSGQSSPPPLITGDFADPSIIRSGNDYFAVGTSSEWAPHFPVYHSTDLRSWQQTGYIFDKAPDWTVGSFWAPEYYRIGNKLLFYYTARRKSDNKSCLGVATSDYPDRGFADHGVLIDHGTEAIDAFVFDDDGQLYISFKAYGLDKRPIELLAYKLSADGLHLEGEPFMLLRDDEKKGMEGQSMLKRNGYYYLFYSAGGCCGAGCSYNVQVARSRNLAGPYEKYEGNPILAGYDNWQCTGHGTFVSTPENAVYYLHHAYDKAGTVYTGRQGMLSALAWNDETNWPRLLAPATTGNQPAGIADEFDAATPAIYWQWDWRHSTAQVQQKNGRLSLAGISKSDNQAGTVLTVRPAQPAFKVQTAMPAASPALTGLAYYGDATAAIGFGVEKNKLIVWQIKNKERKQLATRSLPGEKAELQIQVTAEHKALFKYRLPGKAWQNMPLEPVPVDFLPQWDRSPRPGLHTHATTRNPATFDYFSLVYE
ncbi:MAG: family 43 glycosylhydrolase [Flavihumibacter sp.]